MRLPNVKISSRIISSSAVKFLDSQSFLSTQRSRLILFIVTIITASCQTGGAKQNGGTIAPPAPM